MSSSPPYDTMQAVVGTDFGKPASSHITIQQVPTPVIADPDDVLIKVIAVSLNPIDYKIVHGDLNSLLSLKAPYRLGFDVSGIVQAVGGGVTKFKTGDEVYSRVAHNRMGTISTYTLTHQNTVSFKPKSVTHDQAAGVPLAALTALQALRDIGKMKQADKVLILGASGGVGTFAIQIAKHVLGASEVVVTCSESGASLCRELGATNIIDYKKEKFSDVVKNVDVCFDTTGEANSAFTCLRKGGTVVSIVAAPLPHALERSGIEIGLATKAFFSASAAPTLANAALHGVNYEFLWVSPDGKELTELAEWIDQKKIKVVVDSTFQFTQYKQAFDYLEQGHSKGKVVIHVQEEK